MSRHTARLVLDQMFGRPSLVTPGYGTGTTALEITSGSLLADMRELAGSNLTTELGLFEARKHEMLAAYGFSPTTQVKPFAFADGMAIIPVHGTLINRFAYSFGFVTGYNFIRDQVAAASMDPDVTGIVYDVNSRGGTVAGCWETAAVVAEASARNGGKPSIAVVDSNCMSAAYMTVCGTDHIAVTSSGEVGSIGVLLMHADVSKALEDFGVKITFIHAGAHKVDGNPFEPLSAEVIAAFQTEIDDLYTTFVDAVALGRNMTAQEVRDTEARVYSAQASITAKLTDSVASPDRAIQQFFDGSFTMPANSANAPDSPATVAAAALEAHKAELKTAGDQARTAERARVTGIQTHAEAAGRSKLAAYLAFQTDMTVEDAGALLAASEKEAVVEPKKETTSTEQNHFKNAMDKSKHPNAGAGGDPGGDDPEKQTPSQRILAAQAKATGAKAA